MGARLKGLDCGTCWLGAGMVYRAAWKGRLGAEGKHRLHGDAERERATLRERTRRERQRQPRRCPTERCSLDDDVIFHRVTWSV